LKIPTVRFKLTLNGQNRRLEPNKALDEILVLELRDVTCHPTQVNAPLLNPSQLAGSRFTYPGGMEGWVDY